MATCDFVDEHFGLDCFAGGEDGEEEKEKLRREDGASLASV
jgi:hypothetical protein